MPSASPQTTVSPPSIRSTGASAPLGQHEHELLVVPTGSSVAVVGRRLGDHDLEGAGEANGSSTTSPSTIRTGKASARRCGAALLLDGADEGDHGDGAVVAGGDRGDQHVVGLGADQAP